MHKRIKRVLIYYDTDTVCTFLGLSPLSGYKNNCEMVKNVEKRDEKVNNSSFLVELLSSCPVL